MTYTITFFEVAGAWLLLFSLTLLALALPALPQRWMFPRWAQGWLIPHSEPQVSCRVECATCRGRG